MTSEQHVCDNTFITKAMEKVSADLKVRFTKYNAAKFIAESLRDLTNVMTSVSYTGSRRGLIISLEDFNK